MLFHGPVCGEPCLCRHRTGEAGGGGAGRPGVHLNEPGPLLVAGVGYQSGVQCAAVMLLLPHLQGMTTGVMLALVAAGNLLLVGSIANLIVVDLAQARRGH